MSQVTLIIKNATLVPSPNVAMYGLSLPALTLTCEREVNDSLSSDKTEPAFSLDADGVQFAKAAKVDQLSRGSGASLTFVLSSTSDKNKPLGKGTVKVDDLIKHAEFAVALREQALVLKHDKAPCPLRLDLAGERVVDGAMLSLDLDLLEGASADAASSMAGDTRSCMVFLSAQSILATRGSKTDSFARVLLVTDTGVEHEVGRTERVNDELSPEFNTYIALSYSVEAATKPNSKVMLRFEICDPGQAPQGSPSKKGKEEDTFTTIGACQKLLSELHVSLEKGDMAMGNRPGLYRECHTLKQKGELQGLLKAKEKEKESKYGFLFTLIENVKPNDQCVSMIIGASKLKTNKLSMRPDPYVRIYRLLDVGDSAPEGVPTRCPVYASNYVRNTREASWSTVPIPMQLLSNSDPNARVVVEVWDFQFQAEDRLIGSVAMSVSDLLFQQHGAGPKDPKQQTYVEPFYLQPPSLFAQTGSAVDRTASLLTGGVAAKPGTFSVYNVKTFQSQELAQQSYDCFDVDTVLREKKASQPLVWEGLKSRRQKHIIKVRSGVVQTETTCCIRIGKSRRACLASLANCGVQQFFMKHCAIFHKTRKFVGAKLGSAFEAYFAFAYSLIRLNLLLALLWFLFVVFPQYVLSDPAPNLIRDLLVTFDAQTYAESAAQAIEAAAQADPSMTAVTVDLSAIQELLACGDGNMTFCPGVFLFDGYLPKLTRGFGDLGLSGLSGVSDGYPLDFFYVALVFATMGISLFSVVCSLGGQVGAVRETGSSSRADGTGQVMEAIFGGWDHQGISDGASRQTRYALVTQMKEGLGEAERAAERKARVLTEKEKRNLCLVRTVAFTLSFAFVVTSVALVVYSNSPPGVMTPDFRSVLDELSESSPLPLHTLIVTLINLFCPIVIKLSVRLERYDSPEIEIRQQLIRQVALKLANLVVLFLVQRTGQTRSVLPNSDPASCPEGKAAKNFILLLVTDAVVQVVVYLVKFLQFYPARWMYRFCGKKVEVELPDGTTKITLKAIPEGKGVLGPLGKKGLVDLPTEIVNICYRQTILLIATLFSPWIFVIGLFSNTIVYFVKYLTFAYLVQPPKKPFKAANVKALFFAVLLISNIVGLFPVAYFLSAPNNPNCGPLRTASCAAELGHYSDSSKGSADSLFKVPGAENATTCLELQLTGRSNYAAFTSALLPVDIADVVDVGALMAGNFTGLSMAGEQGGPMVILSMALTAGLSSVTLMLVLLLVCICLYFARKQASRLNTELDAANEEAAAEHHDKVKLLRYAGVSLD